MTRMKFRFLDPSLARRYDFDGPATTVFAFVGFQDDKAGNPPRTIVVPRNIIQELRRVVVLTTTTTTTMAFDGPNPCESKRIDPRIVATASFHGALVNSRASPTKSLPFVNNQRRFENANELKTCEDVQRMLQRFQKGDDIVIWIDVSPLGFLPDPGNKSTSLPPDSLVGNNNNNNNENNDPNKRTTPSSSSSSFAATTTPENGNKAEAIAFVPTPGFPIFSDFCANCLDFSDHTTATDSVVTITSIDSGSSSSSSSSSSRRRSSSSNILVQETELVFRLQQDNGQDSTGTENDESSDSDDDNIRQLLALAGCSGLDDRRYTDATNDERLPGLWVSDDVYPGDEEKHTLPGMDPGIDTHSPVPTKSVSDNTVPATANHLLPSFFDRKTSLYFVSSSTRNGMTSLLEGHEMEMATILESVIDRILFPEEEKGFGNGASSDASAFDAGGSPKRQDKDTMPLVSSCPTPNELLRLAMAWNDDESSHSR